MNYFAYNSIIFFSTLLILSAEQPKDDTPFSGIDPLMIQVEDLRIRGIQQRERVENLEKKLTDFREEFDTTTLNNREEELGELLTKYNTEEINNIPGSSDRLKKVEDELIEIGQKKIEYNTLLRDLEVQQSFFLALNKRMSGLKEFCNAVGRGEAMAQYNLGFMYANGNGVPKDYTEAVKWFRKAAEQGLAEAQCILGLVAEDDTEAVKWYRKAAEQGHASAQFELGKMYTQGFGIPADVAEAVKWYHRAAEQGHASAQFHLGLAYSRGFGIPEDDSEAVKWYRKAAEQGQPNAQYNLGNIYANGIGVPKDEIEAVKFYLKAAEQGLVKAQYNLGVAYADGIGIPEDDTEAVKWYRKAAEQGHASAQYNLGMMYYYGTGVTEDYVESYMWLNLSAAQGTKEAKQNKEFISGKMIKEQIAEAQKLSREWLAKHSEKNK